MESRERTTNRRSRLWATALAAALACVLMTGTAAAAPVTGAVVIPDVAATKPTVTIQGNVVVDKNKPTGFYELALCVKTARDIYLKGTDTPVLEEVYEQDIAQNPENADLYDVVNYPFQSAAVTVHIDLDALTAVTWETGKPAYKGWTAQGATGTSGQYEDFDAVYPRGIDMNADENKADTNFVTLTNSIKDMIGGTKTVVRLYTANPDEVTNATALIEGYDPTNNSALLTLSANTTTNTNVVYEKSTPVVVVRFAYDLNRMKNTTVPLEGEPNQSDFWVGANRNMQNGPDTQGKRPLTYLGASDPSGGYATSDTEAAMASIHQAVWYTQNLISDNVGQNSTDFYYYLGAETPSHLANTQEVRVRLSGATTTHQLAVPNTAGNMVLANRVDDDPPGLTIGLNQEYSFFQNLLSLEGERTLRMTLVNAETYRKPTGGVGGAQILFYDWDDSLIGALVVDPEGDARAAVNEYVERVMIHEDLHTGNILASATDYDDLQTKVNYQDYLDRVNSLDREFTYRGSYAYTVGGNDEIGKNGDNVLQGRADGANYPLTNKLDYAFYRRETKQIEETDADGVVTRYFVTNPVSEGDGSEDYDGYLYPYVYGWAIVEDETQDLTKDNWILHKDSVKTQDIWTTFGVGELANLKPGGGAAGQVTDPDTGLPVDYTYAVSSKDAAGYLKFADFSAMEKLLREGQDVVIVKAVYEPGRSLLPDDHYTVVDGSLKIERYSYAASTEESVYSFQYQYRRASDATGPWRGVKRTRLPAVQTGFTYDVNAFDSESKDLNPAKDTKAFYMKTISDNVDIMDIDITAGGMLWKIDYVLVDIYGYNIATGVKRSAGKELDLKNNFRYDDVEYPDRQGTNGFVLEATLNTLLAEATKGARNETNTLQVHFSLTTITDMNLREDSTGTEFDFLDYDYCATYLQDLVTRIYNSPIRNSVLDKYGNVQLGWHQIQRHILMCMQAGGAVDGIFSGNVLMSEEACAGFPWCRLDTCAKEVKVDIFVLGDIFVAMDKKKDETGDKRPATDALNELMSKPAGESLLDSFWFRKSEIGEKFTGRTELMSALENVYKVLSNAGLTQDQMKAITADQVQEIIITGQYPTTGKTYWWKDGGKRPISTWKDFIEAGVLVATNKVPDALDAMTNDKLPNAVQDMISYAAPTGSPANVGWFRYKDSQEDDNEYANVEAFKADWVEALKALINKGHYDLPKDWDTIPWEEIQYALIQQDYNDVTSILSTENYWWKNGGQPKLTYEKLVTAINKMKVDGDSSMLDTLLAKGINPVNNEVYLRRTDGGGSFASVAEFKTTVNDMLTLLQFAQNGSDFINVDGTLKMTIYEMQYMLLNYTRLPGSMIPHDTEIRNTYDYWWLGETHLPTDAQTVNDIMDLLKYAYWSNDGVDGNALPFEPLAKLDAATMTKLGLRAEIHGVPYSDEDVIALVKAAVKKLPYNVNNYTNQSAADLTKEMQYVLLHNAHSTAASITENYWWQTGGFKITDQTSLLQAGWLYTVGFGGKTVPDGRSEMQDLDFISRRPDELFHGLALRTNLNGEAFPNMAAFQTALTSAVQKMEAAGLGYDDMASVTNYQLQYMLLGGEYKSDADVKSEVIVDGKDAYWWFTSDTPPEEEEEKPEEIPIDETEWAAFMAAIKTYYKTQTTTISYPLTDEIVKDTLLLRNADGSVLTAAELHNGSTSDMIYKVLNAIWNSDRKTELFDTKKKALKVDLTWYEFQYIISNLTKIMGNGTIPDAEACKAWATAETVSWKYTTPSGTKTTWIQWAPGESEPKPGETTVDSAWGDFMAAIKTYYKTQTATISSLTDEIVKDTLLLRNADGSEITAAELHNGSTSDMIYKVLNAIWNSDRKTELFDTKKKALKVDLTWYEFQYIISNLTKIMENGTIPTAADCKAWATKEKAPQSWFEVEVAEGASLFELMEVDEPVLEPDWVDEDEVAPERPTESPGSSRRRIYDEVLEIPVGEESFAMTDPQGGF